MVPVHSILPPLHFPRKILASFIYGKGIRRRAADRKAIFVDLVAILFHHIRQIGRRRHPARSQRHAPIYDCDVHRFGSARCFGFSSLWLDKKCNGHMVCVVSWLDHRHAPFRFLLQEKYRQYAKEIQKNNREMAITE